MSILQTRISHFYRKIVLFFQNYTKNILFDPKCFFQIIKFQCFHNRCYIKVLGYRHFPFYLSTYLLELSAVQIQVNFEYSKDLITMCLLDYLYGKHKRDIYAGYKNLLEFSLIY